MFTVARPDEDILAEVADTVGPRLGRLVETDVRPAVAELDEVYPCWLLTPDAVTTGAFAAAPNTDGVALEKIARDLGQWHYQILFDGTPTAFARATGRLVPGAPVEVLVVGYSDVAQQVAECIAWARDNAPDGAEARLLLAPAWYVTALWLRYPTDSQVVVARQPAGLQRLRPHTLYRATTFLRLLTSEAPTYRPS